jgi:hypothetical protein
MNLALNCVHKFKVMKHLSYLTIIVVVLLSLVQAVALAQKPVLELSTPVKSKAGSGEFMGIRRPALF